MKQPYDDILHLPHHVSPSRRPMAIQDRAAQFAPFAALTGHGAAIQETARLTDVRLELDESAKAMLNEKLRYLLALREAPPEVTITWFRPDDRKSGGAYLQTTGMVKKLDPYGQSIILADKAAIPIEDIISIDSDVFLPLE